MNWLLLCFFSLVSGVTLQGKILPNEILTDLSLLGTGTRILLNHQPSTFLKFDGSFSIQDVKNGIYILQLVHEKYSFEMVTFKYVEYKIRIQVNGPLVNASRYFTGFSIRESGPILPYPLELKAKAQYQFFTPRESFNIWGLLTNPMMLMSLFSLAAVYIMPKMMENMDPEALKEFQQEQQKVPNVNELMSKMFQ